MNYRIVTDYGRQVAVEATRERLVELLIVCGDAPAGGRLFFDRLNAGLLADSIMMGLRSDHEPPAPAAGSTSRSISAERWSATATYEENGGLKLSLLDEQGTAGNFLHFDRPNAGYLAEALILAIS